MCSYLGNKTEKLNVGQFAKLPVNPDNVIKGADPKSFFKSLRAYNNNYLQKAKNFRISMLDTRPFSVAALFCGASQGIIDCKTFFYSEQQ